MNRSVAQFLTLIASLVIVIGCLLGINTILMSSSNTYVELAEEIDHRDIDTGNALNYLGDETSSRAVFGATQTIQHPPGVNTEN